MTETTELPQDEPAVSSTVLDEPQEPFLPEPSEPSIPTIEDVPDALSPEPYTPGVAIMRVPVGVYDMDFLQAHFSGMQHWASWGDPADPAFCVIAFDTGRSGDVIDALNNHDALLLAHRKREVLKNIGNMRWAKTQAFVYDGVMTHADPAIAVVNATLTMRQRRNVPAAYPQQWKLADGAFRLWNEDQIEAFGFAIADHIQQCFDREANLSDQINIAMTNAELDGIVVGMNEGWP